MAFLYGAVLKLTREDTLQTIEENLAQMHTSGLNTVMHQQLPGGLFHTCMGQAYMDSDCFDLDFTMDGKLTIGDGSYTVRRGDMFLFPMAAER